VSSLKSYQPRGYKIIQLLLLARTEEHCYLMRTLLVSAQSIKQWSYRPSWLCAHNPVYKSVTINYSMLDSWPDDHVPQEIRDAFIALGSEMESTQPIVTDEQEGYVTSLQGGLFKNDLDAEVEDAELGSILSRSFFSDFHGQDIQSTPATLASL
jgi:hypothetical protein